MTQLKAIRMLLECSWCVACRFQLKHMPTTIFVHETTSIKANNGELYLTFRDYKFRAVHSSPMWSSSSGAPDLCASWSAPSGWPLAAVVPPVPVQYLYLLSVDRVVFSCMHALLQLSSLSRWYIPVFPKSILQSLFGLPIVSLATVVGDVVYHIGRFTNGWNWVESPSQHDY